MINRKFIDYETLTRYKRVSKAAAKKAFNNGEWIVFCPTNLDPFGFWRPSTIIRKCHENYTFERVVNRLSHYMTFNHETGYYMAFYVPIEIGPKPITREQAKRIKRLTTTDEYNLIMKEHYTVD